MQIPSWDARLFDLKRAAESAAYCDEIRGVLAANGLELTELSTHLQGQLIAVHPAYDSLFDSFAPEAVHGNSGGSAGVGNGATWVCGEGFKKPRPDGTRDLLRRAGVAVRLSLAATPERLG